MKKFLLSALVAAAAAVPAFAGVDNINYQAVIKNGNNVVANEKVELKFELLDKAEKVVYSEIQSVTTNAAGYVSCQLGQDNDLTAIDWDNLTLSVSANLGSGYQVIATEAVSSVPTALYALHSADSAEIIETVEDLMMETELNKETILGINAEIVRLQGLNDEATQNFDNLGENLTMSLTAVDARLEEVDSQLENLNMIAGVVRANEEAIEGIQKDFDNLGENLTMSLTSVDARLEEVDAQLENLNHVSAVVRVNEDAIEELQGDFKNLGENLDNSFAQMTAKFEEVDGQLENLNHVSAVVRVNEDAIEKLTAENENLKNEIADLQEEIDSLRENLMELMKVIQGDDYDNPTPIK